MYFFILIILLLVILNPFEKKYHFILYLKISIVSIIYFYYLNTISNSILSLFITIGCFIIITQLIYKIIYREINSKEEDNTLFNLAHEVKNPLTVCKGYLDMISNKDKFDKLEIMSEMI